ncbi:hypothetical protein [Halopiger djelfimassiliensis]|uniref:hypothetical protein n=1 Tax=Halopiger djelfimassiliensis TaxID=1293047 RepID=UPI000678108E|nr:hypothetical protein [Halopiger djelfimassiliensis]
MAKVLTPSPEQYADALDWVENCPHEYDPDGGMRSPEEWELDVFLARLSEHFAVEWLESEGFDVRHVPDSETDAYDLIVDGYRVEVKFRKLWDYRGPDLLIRRRREECEADAYLMVEMDRIGGPASYNGWVTKCIDADEADALAEPYEEGSHDKEKVSRDYLLPAGCLRAVLGERQTTTEASETAV